MKKTLIALFLLAGFNSLEAQEEKHLANLQQLTFGGDNAEAYFSPDGKKLSFQSNFKGWGLHCDQIFMLDIARRLKDTSLKVPMVSTGKGRTTCSFYMPDNKSILFASTHNKMNECPPDPPRTGKYLWSIHHDYDIFVSDEKGKVLRQLTNSPGYDAEGTVSPKGDKIVFTSTRNGDLDLYTMNIDGSEVKQITFGLGYDGGAFFSPDGKKIVFRASRPKEEADVKEYKELLTQGYVAPANMEIYTCNADGSELKQVTALGKANWAPFYHPSGKKIMFSSNHHSQRGFDFQLFMVDEDGKNLEQVTTESNFNAFPMFSADGKKMAFSSNRKNGGTRDTNVFIADWKE